MNTQKLNNRKIKSIETKKRIFDTANQLFKKYGFQKVTVDSIVETAGVSKGAFYLHFESKNALIAQIISDSVNNADLNYKSFLQGFPTGMTASHILISLVGKITDFIVHNIGYSAMSILYEALLTRTVNGDALLSYNRDLYKLFNEIIKQGVQQGEFTSDIDADTISNHCIVAIRGLTYEWCIRYPEFDYKGQVIEHFELLLKGIKVIK